MGLIITYGSEMIRINTEKNIIERSLNGGRVWLPHCTSSVNGVYSDLLVYGNEILACTSKGVYCSKNGGLVWLPRCTSPIYGRFIQLNYDGKRLLATTTQGLYYSVNGGVTWLKVA